jgi:electron transfer flavoprotein beta subunit
VTDPALAGADIAATARVLAAAARHVGADLVLLGQQASDSDSYVMAAAVAEHLQWPLVTQVARLELTGSGIQAKRQSETGYDVVEAPLPAVLSVSDAINEPRYASLKAIMGARKKPQHQVALADLDVVAGTGTEVLALTPPPAKEGGRRIEDEGGDSAEAIVAFLLERKAI